MISRVSKYVPVLNWLPRYVLIKAAMGLFDLESLAMIRSSEHGEKKYFSYQFTIELCLGAPCCCFFVRKIKNRGEL